MNNEKKSKVKILFELESTNKNDYKDSTDYANKNGQSLKSKEGTCRTEIPEKIEVKEKEEVRPLRSFRIVFEQPEELRHTSVIVPQVPEPSKKPSVKIVFSIDDHKDKDEKIRENDKKEKNAKRNEKPKSEEVKEKWAWVSPYDQLNVKNDESVADNSENLFMKSETSKNTLLLEGEIDEVRDREIVYPVTNGVMLAEEYRKGSNRIPQVDPTGFWASEKYDGIRVLWDGISLWTRAMNQINAPIWFQARLPPSFSLDGELFIKRDHFNETSGIIRNKVPNPDDWASMKFMVFDIPHLGTKYPFEKRLEILKEIVHRYGEPLTYINHIKIKSSTHLDGIHQDLMSKGAEGTMIRAPNSYYESGRSRSLLKVKDQYDAECLVEGWEEGKNRNEGRLGALEVTWEDPVGVWEKYGNEYDTPYHGTFKAGSGLSAIDRVLMKDAQKVFPRGTRVKVAFSQLQKSGKPKHPAYKGRV